MASPVPLVINQGGISEGLTALLLAQQQKRQREQDFVNNFMRRPLPQHGGSTIDRFLPFILAQQQGQRQSQQLTQQLEFQRALQNDLLGFKKEENKKARAEAALERQSRNDQDKRRDQQEDAERMERARQFNATNARRGEELGFLSRRLNLTEQQFADMMEQARIDRARTAVNAALERDRLTEGPTLKSKRAEQRSSFVTDDTTKTITKAAGQLNELAADPPDNITDLNEKLDHIVSDILPVFERAQGDDPISAGSTTLALEQTISSLADALANVEQAPFRRPVLGRDIRETVGLEESPTIGEVLRRGGFGESSSGPPGRDRDKFIDAGGNFRVIGQLVDQFTRGIEGGSSDETVNALTRLLDPSIEQRRKRVELIQGNTMSLKEALENLRRLQQGGNSLGSAIPALLDRPSFFTGQGPPAP